MALAIVTSILTCLGIVIVSIFKPNIQIKNTKINLYWIIALLGALVIFICQSLSFPELWNGLTSNKGINPLQIIILFICMSLISIFLDEVGFFAYIANEVIKICKKNQIMIFIAFYILVSSLTMFTSNDIVILTLTPFIIFFCKNGKINPIPYIVSEFIAANTWSMMFIIGNPTNIYLAENSGITFIGYFKKMWLPTLIAGLVEFLLLLFIFRKKLKEPIIAVEIKDVKCKKSYTIIGLIDLLTCTIFLIISSYLNLPMYLISAIALGVLIIIVLLFALIKKEAPKELGKTFLRGPYEIIPFIIAMFTLILALDKYNITKDIANVFGSNNSVWLYGYTSLLGANLLNNIPMSVFFNSILGYVNQAGATYATIIGSNIGAFVTPIGALASIMWMRILKNYEIKYNFLDFIKYGLPIGLVVSTVAFSLLFVTL